MGIESQIYQRICGKHFITKLDRNVLFLVKLIFVIRKCDTQKSQKACSLCQINPCETVIMFCVVFSDAGLTRLRCLSRPGPGSALHWDVCLHVFLSHK